MAATIDLNGPLLPAPEGITSQLDNPPNDNGLALAVLIVCVVIPTISVIIRVFQKMIVPRKVQLEELLTIAAYGCFLGAAYACFALIETPGYFVRGYDTRMGDMPVISYRILLMGIFYAVDMPLVKTAILLDLVRMFVPSGTRSKSYFWWGAMAIIFVQVTAGVAFIILLCVRCTPFEATYNTFVVGKCYFELTPLQLGSGAIQVISDCCMFLLPHPVIWRLKMTWQKRLGVSVVFGVGLLGCVSAAVRLATTVAYTKSTDPIYDMAPLVFWIAAEQACAFFIICVPCLPKLFKETGMMPIIKKIFALPTTAGRSNSNLKYYGDKSNVSRGATTSNSAKDYYKLDEDGVPLRDVSPSSTEQLNEAPIRHPKNGITRITHVTISQDRRSDNDGYDAGKKEAWAR